MKTQMTYTSISITKESLDDIDKLILRLQADGRFVKSLGEGEQAPKISRASFIRAAVREAIENYDDLLLMSETENYE